MAVACIAQHYRITASLNQRGGGFGQKAGDETPSPEALFSHHAYIPTFGSRSPKWSGIVDNADYRGV